MSCGSIRAGFVISAMGVAAANLSACSAQRATRLPDERIVTLELDAVLAPRRAAAVGGGPPEVGDANSQPAEPAAIPKGAVIRLVLMERLIPPGTRVQSPPRELLASPPPAPRVDEGSLR